MVFDDRFSTVESIGLEDTPPTHWEDLCLENTLYVPTDGNTDMPVHLHDDWLTNPERELKYRDLQRQERVRQILHPTATAISLPDPSIRKATTSFNSEGALTEPGAPTIESPIAITHVPNVASLQPQGTFNPSSVTTTTLPTVDSASSLRRSTRATRGEFQATRYIDES